MENRETKPHLKRGLWKPEEDLILKNYVETHGEGNWATVSEKSGLKRGGKSCRLRWKNYLRPNIKRGSMSEEEEDLIIRMHKLLGNRWSLIAGRLPGRTDNEVKNYWNTHLNKKCLVVGKRKTIENDKEGDYDHEIKDEGAAHDKKPRRLNDSHQHQPICSAATPNSNTTTTDQLGADHGKKDVKEEISCSNVTDSWMDETQRFNYVDIESPFLHPYNSPAAFVYEDEPFAAYWDPVVLFEAFGCGVEGTYSEAGIQPYY